MGKAIGIDLGTTNSCAAVVENNQPKIIMYKGGNYTIPSMFAVDDAGNKLVGHDAKKIAQLNPSSTVYGAKRLLGRNFGSKTIEKVRQLFTYEIMEGESDEVMVKIKDQVFSLEQVSAHILDKIREVSEEYLHDEITSAVITVPAYFNERQRQAVRNAGKMARLNVIRILNEPTAAALAYGLGKNLNQKLAVYDLGGGTFDISIIEVKDKIFEVIATGGDTMLGGIDFDNRIMEWIITTFEKEHGIDLSNNIVAVQRIKESAERAKIELSTLEETRLNIQFIARGPKGTLNVDMVLSRDILETLTRDLVDRTLTTCERVLVEAGLTLKELDEVLLVGGQSRMPLVQKRVTEFFGKQPCKGVHPDEAVAVGAAIMAHSLTDQTYHKVELLDVLPMAIGIARVDGTLLRLFPKFHPIPSYKSLTLTNSKDSQKSIMLKIYQGDNEIAAENEILGTFIFSGIREAPRSTVKVEVLFHIDSEGILTLTAKDKETGQQMETILKVKSGADDGDDKKSKKIKGGKAAVRTIKKSDSDTAEGEISDNSEAPTRERSPVPPTATAQPSPAASSAGAGRAPWEAPASGARSTLPPPPTATGKQKWHDPVFDKATKELPKGDVAKILAAAKAEMEAEKVASDKVASDKVASNKVASNKAASERTAPERSTGERPAVASTGERPAVASTGERPAVSGSGSHAPVSPPPPQPSSSRSTGGQAGEAVVAAAPTVDAPPAPASNPAGSSVTAVQPTGFAAFLAWLKRIFLFWKKD